MVADMGYGLPLGHALRSCILGVELARIRGLGERLVAETFYTSMLVHIGCVSFSHEMSEAFGDELTANRAGALTNFQDPRDIFATLIPNSLRGLPPSAQVRGVATILVRGRQLGRRYDTTTCEVARATARRLGLPEAIQRALYQAKECWNGHGAPQGLKEEAIDLPARIARVAAEASLFNSLGGAAMATAALESRSGRVLDPSLVVDFVASAPELLARVEAGDPRPLLLELEPQPFEERGPEDLSQLAAAFGDLADLKTPFTSGHSQGVENLANAAAKALAMDGATAERLRVAARLADLGRVGISNALWEKPGPLTSPEWEQVRIHPYYSERILSGSDVLRPIARLAGSHHERMDGSGYHRGSRADELDEAARVLAAADAFQAMMEPRPHREALDGAEAAEKLRLEGREGRLDPAAVAAVLGAGGERVGRRSEIQPGGLSDREIEVLRLVARACSNREIAERLTISRRTAEHHVQHIYAKIGVSTRSAATLFAMENNLLDG